MSVFSSQDYYKHNYKYSKQVLNDILLGNPIKLSNKNGELLNYSRIDKKKVSDILANITNTNIKYFNALFPNIKNVWTKIYKGAYTNIPEKKKFERQEWSLVSAINNAVKNNENKPITVKFEAYGDIDIIKNVVSANKVEGLNAYNKEPYADVEIHTIDSVIKLSCKDFKNAPSLLGGGLLGIHKIYPAYIKPVLVMAFNKVKNTEDFKNNIWKDIYIKLDNSTIITLFRGNPDMGGPIDYVYRGDMEVSSYVDYDNVLRIKGQLLSSIEFAKLYTGKLYIRVRRQENEGINTDIFDKNGIPYFTFKSDGKRNNRRIVITNSLNKNGILA